MAKRIRKKTRSRRAPEVVKPGIFWPDQLDNVKAIAMRGLTDDEMAAMMGISPDLLQSWKAYYPTLAKAIEDGRTTADAQVVRALHSNAIGFEYETDEVVRTRRGASVVTVKKRFLPETTAQKFWLQNRKPDQWNVPQQVAVGGRGKGENPAIVVENKNDIISSILNMITPRPDREVAT